MKAIWTLIFLLTAMTALAKSPLLMSMDNWIRADDEVWQLSEFRAIPSGIGIVEEATWLSENRLMLKRKAAVGRIGQSKTIPTTLFFFDAKSQKSATVPVDEAAGEGSDIVASNSGDTVAVVIRKLNSDSLVVVRFYAPFQSSKPLDIQIPGKFETVIASRLESQMFVAYTVDSGGAAETRVAKVNPSTGKLEPTRAKWTAKPRIKKAYLSPSTGAYVIEWRDITDGYPPTRIVFSPSKLEVWEASNEDTNHMIAFSDGEYNLDCPFIAWSNFPEPSCSISHQDETKETEEAVLHGADEVALNPTGSRGVALIRGAALWFDIVPSTMKKYQAAKDELLRSDAIRRAKEIGAGLLMFASDEDHILPPSTAYIKELLLPYTKDRELARDFVYTFKGGSLIEIEDENNTELGYIDAPGGRAVLYVDSTVRWIPD